MLWFNYPFFTETYTEDDVLKTADAINILSLEEVKMPNYETSSNKKGIRKHTSGGGPDPGPKERSGDRYYSSGGQHVVQQQKKYYTSSDMKKAREVSRGTSQVNMQPAGAASDIVRSGHIGK